MQPRRRFLRHLAAWAMGAGVAVSARPARTALRADPFRLGVASGYPGPTGVVLWTRLLFDADGPDAARVADTVPVVWQVAGDPGMQRAVASGTAPANPAWAHTVHVEVQGLQPGREYWYRFRAGDAWSPVGRTRTAPAADATPDRLRFAFASCQQYEHGYYGAHRDIAADAPDLVAFLGDYIYERSWGRAPVRSHGAGEARTLDDYRGRYALYRSDPDLQAAHAACPWIVTWDDHEVDNDYAADRGEEGEPPEVFLARRAAAYRAYYEHMPLPAAMRPDGPAMRLHTHLDWGRLARFHVLDDRQYRDPQACPRRAGGSSVVDPAGCAALRDPRRSMLGAAQEAWLEASFTASQARWNIIAQQTLMAQVDRGRGGARRVWTDGWDGYPAARRRLLESARDRCLANPVVIGGDVHFHAVADLRADFDDASSPVIASEFCGTSITSQSHPQGRLDAWRAANPHIHLMDGTRRGYVRIELTRALCRADLRAMASVRVPDAACTTLASFIVEDGRPGPRAA